VTEQEAAEKLCALLNETEAAGYEVGPNSAGDLNVGERAVIIAPALADQPWEVMVS
jgi:hypothetical protein